MARASLMQNAFNAGEISPAMFGRIDLQRTFSAGRTVQNWLVKVQGGLVKRPGTRFINYVKDPARRSELIPFIYSDTQAYVLEFGHLVIRFYSLEALVLSGGLPLEVATPYTEAELAKIQYAQSADVLYLAHPNHAPRKLQRSTPTSWSIIPIDFKPPPYLVPNKTTTTLTPLAVTGNTQISASAGIFNPEDVGRWVRINHPTGAPAINNWGSARITGYVSPTLVNVTVVDNFALLSARTTWRMTAWWSELGYPSVVSFNEQRLWWGASVSQPQTMWGSRSADFEDHQPTDYDGAVADDHGLTYTLSANDVNPIRWANPARTFIVGTVGGIFPIQASSSLEPVTPTNIRSSRSSISGAVQAMPVNAEDETIYISKTSRRLFSTGYVFERDNYSSEDLCLYADHIGKGGITRLQYAHEPNSTVWARRGDGTLLGCTYHRAQQVIGWNRQVIGGAFAGGQAVVEGLAVIPSPSGDHDQIWVTVKRTVNGSTVRYVELFEREFADDDSVEDARFSDSALHYSGAATATLAGLGHLVGQTVQINANGGRHPDKVVSVTGTVTLDYEVTKASVGLRYVSDFEPMRPEVPDQEGTSQGKTKRVSHVILRTYRSVGGKIGRDFSNLVPIPYREPFDLMDAPLPLITGDIEVPIDTGHETDGFIAIRHDEPFPFYLAAMMPRVVGGVR